jgi:uncharacterized Ntn-hydrolase superfamily protein
MNHYWVEGAYIKAQDLKKAARRGPAGLSEPFARHYWADSPEEALAMALEDLCGGQWVGAPDISDSSEDQRMRDLGMPELPGMSKPGKGKRARKAAQAAVPEAKTKAARKPKPKPRRPVATYSIVARDPETGQLGVAVQPHWFSVGPLVPWAEAGLGAVATQAMVRVDYGPLGLERMRAGLSAPEALAELIADDPAANVRQIGMVDAQGRGAAHTGESATPEAGHYVGDGFTVQANLMLSDCVWPAMAQAFEASSGDLAERLMLTLEAAERAGGDIRGRQSAAMLVVSGTNTGKPWDDRLVDLRVEDHPDPLVELRRLLNLSRMYRLLNEGDLWIEKGEIEKAAKAYNAALEMAPDQATNGEAAFWTGVSLANVGKVDEALGYLARAQAVHRWWAVLLGRLPASGMLPDDPELIERLRRGMAAG